MPDEIEKPNSGLFDDSAFRKIAKPARRRTSTRSEDLSPDQRIGKFFEAPKPQSIVKTKIVASYFSRWADVMIHNKAEILRYIDLFCGPGVYGDEYLSTPLQILQRTIAKRELRNRLAATFNDKEEHFVDSLEAAVNKLPGISTLRYKPEFLHENVADQFIQRYDQTKLHPTLAFLDPCGYKGLSVRLMRSVLKDFGCDLIFFFNYNRVNMHSENSTMKENLDTLFGEKWAAKLKAILAEEKDSSPLRREEIILSILKESLREKGGLYFLPFRFREGNKTLHHIILVSKHYKAYEIMKDVMKNHSIVDADGIPFFEFNSKCMQVDQSTGVQLSLLEPPPPRPKTRLQLLCNDIYLRYKGRTVTVEKLFTQHNVDTPYILKSYKDAIRLLEEMKRVKCDRPPDKRRKHKVQKMIDGRAVTVEQVTVADDLRVTFL
jgi:three-Cys-motif partner protein